MKYYLSKYDNIPFESEEEVIAYENRLEVTVVLYYWKGGPKIKIFTTRHEALRFAEWAYKEEMRIDRVISETIYSTEVHGLRSSGLASVTDIKKKYA